MTQSEIKFLLKRYHFITDAMEHHRSAAFFSIGTRKERISIDDDVKKFVRIVKTSLDLCTDPLEKSLMKQRYECGESDVYVMMHACISKSVYYKIKTEFSQRVYECCILEGLVSLEEINGNRII